MRELNNIEYGELLNVTMDVDTTSHEHKFTLSQAQKIIKKMKKELTLLTKDYGTLTIHNTILIKSNIDTIRNDNMKLENNFIKYNLLSHNITLLRNKLYYMNGQIGLDNILSNIDLLTALKSQYVTMLKAQRTAASILHIDELTDKFMTELKLNNIAISYNNNLSNTILFYNDKDLQEKVNLLSKEITALESKRDHLNATERITVPLYDTVSVLIDL